MAKRKSYTFAVTVSVNASLTKAEAKREVRTLISEQRQYLSGKSVGLFGWEDVEVKCRKVANV